MIFLRQSAHLPIGVDLGTNSVKLLQLRQRGGALAVGAAAQHSIPRVEKTDDGQTAGAAGANQFNNNPAETNHRRFSHTGLQTAGATSPTANLPAAISTNATVTAEDQTGRVERSIAALRPLIRAHGFKGRHIVGVLPREFVQTKTIRMPVVSDAELAELIAVEAGQLFNTDPSQLSIRHVVAGEFKQAAESRFEVIVLAVENRLIDSLLDSFQSIGLIVSSLDLEASSLYRGIERFVRRKEDENEVNVLIDIGARQCQIVIGRGQELTFTKSIGIGGNHLTECVANRLALSFDEAASLRRRFADVAVDDDDSVRKAVHDATRHTINDLTHEIGLCLRYYSVTFRGQRPSRVRLLGGEAYDLALRTALSAALPVTVDVYEPLAGVDTANMPGVSDKRFCQWGVAFGAALRNVKSGSPELAGTARFNNRRSTDTSRVEVVDVTKAIHAAGSTATPTREAAHA